MTLAVLLDFGDTAAQLATFAQQASPGDFGHYALKVVSAAEAGDTQALTLRQNTVQAIQTGLDVVGFTGRQPVCLVGGLGTALRGVLDPGYHQWVIPPKGQCTFWGNRNCPRPVGPARAIVIGNATPPVLCPSPCLMPLSCAPVSFASALCPSPCRSANDKTQ